MNCKCQNCSNLQQGGTLLIIDDSWFTLSAGNYELSIDRVASFINLTELIKRFEFFLIDYGYYEIIQTCAPYSQPEFLQQRPIIINNLITNNYKNGAPFFQKYQDATTSFEKCLAYLLKKFRGREIVIATCNRPTGFQLIDDKMVYYWNPYNEDNRVIRRIFKQSRKHRYKSKDPEETFCPIPDSELSCALQRAISMQSNNSFLNERFEICSYHEKYELIIKNKYTTDKVVEIPNNFKFAYRAHPIITQEIEYHGFHIDSSSENGKQIFSMLKESSLPINSDIIKSNSEYVRRETAMLLELA